MSASLLSPACTPPRTHTRQAPLEQIRQASTHRAFGVAVRQHTFTPQTAALNFRVTHGAVHPRQDWGAPWAGGEAGAPCR